MSSGTYTTGSKVTLQSGLVVNEINYTNTAGNTTYSIYQIDETSSGLRLFEGVSSSEFDGGSQARRHNRLTSPAYEKTTKPPYL